MKKRLQQFIFLHHWGWPLGWIEGWKSRQNARFWNSWDELAEYKALLDKSKYYN